MEPENRNRKEPNGSKIIKIGSEMDPKIPFKEPDPEPEPNGFGSGSQEPNSKKKKEPSGTEKNFGSIRFRKKKRSFFVFFLFQIAI
jgi:hypothetical protein